MAQRSHLPHSPWCVCSLACYGTLCRDVHIPLAWSSAPESITLASGGGWNNSCSLRLQANSILQANLSIGRYDCLLRLPVLSAYRPDVPGLLSVDWHCWQYIPIHGV